MRVLLIQPLLNPSYDLPSLGIATVASALEEKGHEVKILDLNLQSEVGASVEASVSKCLKHDAELVGLTCWGNMSPFVIEFSRRFRSIRPEVKLVIGGEYATFRSEDILRESMADFIVRGEGEQTLLELVRKIEEGGNPYEVKGISYRSRDGVLATPNRRLMDMDEIPFTNWEIFDDLDRYEGYKKRSQLPIQASRGCSFKCIFCSVQRSWGGIQRRKSPERLIHEIKWLTGNFGVTSLSFCDDTFTLNRRWVTKVCNLMLDENVGIHWSALTRVDLVDREILSLMRKAGCVLLFYGVESVCPGILEFIGGKSYGEDFVKKKIRETISAGIEAHVSVIFGWPVDTPETIAHTSRFCQEMTRIGVSKIHCHLLFPLPGTRLVQEYSSLIVPNPYPKATQPDLASLSPEYYSLMERHREHVPDFWMFKNQSLGPAATVKMFADAKLSIIGETYRRLLVQESLTEGFESL